MYEMNHKINIIFSKLTKHKTLNFVLIKFWLINSYPKLNLEKSNLKENMDAVRDVPAARIGAGNLRKTSEKLT